jgi:hypothetical protein
MGYLSRFLGLFIFLSILAFNQSIFGENFYFASKVLVIWYISMSIFLIPFLLISKRQGSVIESSIGTDSPAPMTAYNIMSYELHLNPKLIHKVLVERALLIAGAYLFYVFGNQGAVEINEIISTETLIGGLLIFLGYLIKKIKI